MFEILIMSFCFVFLHVWSVVHLTDVAGRWQHSRFATAPTQGSGHVQMMNAITTAFPFLCRNDVRKDNRKEWVGPVCGLVWKKLMMQGMSVLIGLKSEKKINNSHLLAQSSPNNLKNSHCKLNNSQICRPFCNYDYGTVTTVCLFLNILGKPHKNLRKVSMSLWSSMSFSDVAVPNIGCWQWVACVNVVLIWQQFGLVRRCGLWYINLVFI